MIESLRMGSGRARRWTAPGPNDSVATGCLGRRGKLMSDEARSEHGCLVQQAMAGDQQALEQLLLTHLPQLRAFVRLRMTPALRERESSSDIVQSVCRELLAQQMQGFEYRGEAAFRSWLCTAALNKIRKKARWHRRRPGPAEPPLDQSYHDYCASVFTPSRLAMGHEALRQLEAAFDHLPDHYREVITLARIAELSHAEIAAETGLTAVAARQLLHRAMAALTTELARVGLASGG